MVRITLRYFAAVRESLGRGEETREIEPGTTTGVLFDTLVAEEPGLGAMRSSTMLMVNEEYVRADRELRDGDEVALIPRSAAGAVRSGSVRSRSTLETSKRRSPVRTRVPS